MFQKFKREPDVIIGELDNPYLFRWFIIPKNRFFNIYLHRFMRSDDDRALHDHPWWSIGMLLSGRYLEHVPDYSLEYTMIESSQSGPWKMLTNRWIHRRATVTRLRRPFRPIIRRAGCIHRVELMKTITGKERPVWTLFITGPKIREWGFWCPKGFKHWREFVKLRPGGNQVGAGCEDE